MRKIISIRNKENKQTGYVIHDYEKINELDIDYENNLCRHELLKDEWYYNLFTLP